MIPAEEAFVRRRPVEQGFVEEPLLVDRGQLQVVGDVRGPEQVGGYQPGADRRYGKREPGDAGAQAGAVDSKGSGGGSGSGTGPSSGSGWPSEGPL